ncbi:hypothetical protein MATR_11020 [Marivirga tractuosa]|uniref:Uncharacterized protein n=1 Tax=Marivirga tractuosa (strain ATCC 23168 / DSM 4126 / NBRC 15989 / NCIMB 1408 / VKM B-1430 / H-43) TaxID=643867 RepID=E4TLE8_MARTH|nr:hypothetical protein Ftrac_1278 [Marivirga tractuosa DSM 4126]BDD14277.1 hypothetical protein MATR_11020 [Marivirga tractuosa]
MWKNKSICSVISLDTSTFFKQTPNINHQYLSLSQYFEVILKSIIFTIIGKTSIY